MLSGCCGNDLELLQIQYCTVWNLYQLTISAVCSFIKLLIYMNKTLSGCLQELQNKGKSQLGNPNSCHGRFQEQSLTRVFHHKVLMGFHKGGRN